MSWSQFKANHGFAACVAEADEDQIARICKTTGACWERVTGEEVDNTFIGGTQAAVIATLDQLNSEGGRRLVRLGRRA